MRGNDDSMDMSWCAFQGAHYLLQVVYLPTPNCRLWEAHFCQIARHFYVFPWLWFWQCREWVICLHSRITWKWRARRLCDSRSLSQCKIARSDDCIYFSLSFIVVCLLYFETGMTLKPNILECEFLSWRTDSEVCHLQSFIFIEAATNNNIFNF